MKLAPNRYMYAHLVSMKSGLEGRNNRRQNTPGIRFRLRLNEVRPRRPEQSLAPALKQLMAEVSQ